MAKTLGLDENYFITNFTEKAPTFARLNYYPLCPKPDLFFGVKPHSDAGVLSILLIDKDVGGLQVLRDGKWHNVPTIPHRLLINLGDFIEVYEIQIILHCSICDDTLFTCGTDLSIMDSNNEQWDLQEPSPQGCRKCGERDDLASHVPWP